MSDRRSSGQWQPRDSHENLDPGRSEPQRVGASRAEERRLRASRGRKRRGRLVTLIAVAAVVALVALGAFVGYTKFLGGPDLPADFAGPGTGTVIIQVRTGDTSAQIGAQMLAKDVVASTAAFTGVAVENSSITSVQPGFYQLASQMSAQQAVAQLVDPAARVGNLVISEGRQLHDTRDVNTGAVKKGIYTLISEASCIGSSASAKKCISYDDLNAAGAVDDPDQLGVPSWATEQVRGVPDRDRQLEGLIAARTWDFDPTSSPAAILKQLVSESAVTFEQTGILTAGTSSGLSPYQVLVGASLVERESLPPDFTKVARVILNRLAVPQKLEFDSTVNYALDSTEVATTDADRAAATPWNTYVIDGLPATPISAPSIAAVEAMEKPAPGDWLYFVTINAQGETLFTRDYAEHLANIAKVQPGFLDSGR